MLIYTEEEDYDKNGFVPAEIKASRVAGLFIELAEFDFQVMPFLFMVMSYTKMNKVSKTLLN